MRIAYIISDINKAVFFENTALALREEGFDVFYIVINYSNGAFVDFLRANNFQYYTLNSGKLSRSLPQILRVKKILSEQKITLVHCHLAQANWIGLWASYLNRTPHRIYTRHSGEPLKLMWKEKIIDVIQNKLATRIVSISNVIDELLERQGVKPQKRTIIHHGFEIKRFAQNTPHEVSRMLADYNPHDNYPVIGVIARWMKWKGIQDILEAFKIVLTKHPNALLCLFGATGNGDYHEKISSLLHEIPATNVRIIPFENNVFDLYQLFDVYVHTPVNPTCEAFGQTYVEALASGIPSVFTMSGIAREFVEDKKHALVVPFEDSNAISSAILQILDNRESSREMTERGRQVVSKLFDFSVYQHNLGELYSSLAMNVRKRKKIIYVVSDVNKAVYFEQTALALRELNYELLFVLISCKDSVLDDFLKQHKFKTYYFDVSKLMNTTGVILKLRKIFKFEQPDLVHCHLSKANWVGLNAAMLAGIDNRMYTRHSGKPLQKSRKEQLIDRVQNKISTHIIAISENISNLLNEQNVPSKKQTLIHHGFDLERFRNNDLNEVERMKKMYNLQNQRPVIGVISRWMELKGLDYIIEAFSVIIEDYPDALLCVFGESAPGTYKDQLQKKLKLLPERNVRLVSFENNCFDLYQLFDIYIHVPVNETCEAFGQTYIEALAAGIPSVFTLSGVASEFIVNHENALVVPFKDARSIEQAIRELLKNETLRKKLSENGKSALEQLFALQHYIDNLFSLYNEKIGNLLPSTYKK